MDIAWPKHKIFLEVEGAGHSHWNRYHSDVDKYNAASFLGWRLFRLTFKMINDKGGAGLYFMRDLVYLLKRLEETSVGHTHQPPLIPE